MKILGLVLVLAVSVAAAFFIAKKRKPSEIDVEIDHPSELEKVVEQVVEQPKLEIKKKSPAVKKEKPAQSVTPVKNPKSESQPSQKAKKVAKK
jgi:hypothetical protein